MQPNLLVCVRFEVFTEVGMTVLFKVLASCNSAKLTYGTARCQNPKHHQHLISPCSCFTVEILEPTRITSADTKCEQSRLLESTNVSVNDYDFNLDAKVQLTSKTGTE